MIISKYRRHHIEYLLVASFILGTVNVGVAFEYSPLPALFISISLLYQYSKRRTAQFAEITLLFLIIAGMLTGLAYKNLNAFKEVIFFTTILGGYIYSKRIGNENIKKNINFVLNIYLLVGIAETLVPSFSEIKSQFLTRSYYSIDSIRGVSSLLTEPSFFALGLFACWLIYATTHNFRNIDINFTIKILLGLFLTKSSMILLMIPCVIFFSRSRKFLIFVAFLIGVPALTYLISIDEINFRAIKLIFNTLETGVSAEALDESSGARLFYIFKDINIAMQTYFLPAFNGSYEYLSEIYGSNVSLETIYDQNLSGSLLGRFVVEFGFMTIFYLVYIYSILWRRLGVIASALLWFSLVVILLQMISMIFYPLAFSLGVFLHYVSQRATFGKIPNLTNHRAVVKTESSESPV